VPGSAELQDGFDTKLDGGDLLRVKVKAECGGDDDSGAQQGAERRGAGVGTEQVVHGVS
jgi:hypothetical protein